MNNLHECLFREGMSPQANTTIYLVRFARWANIQGEEIRGNPRLTMAHNGVNLMGQGVNYDALPNLNLFSTVPAPQHHPSPLPYTNSNTGR